MSWVSHLPHPSDPWAASTMELFSVDSAGHSGLVSASTGSLCLSSPGGDTRPWLCWRWLQKPRESWCPDSLLGLLLQGGPA